MKKFIFGVVSTLAVLWLGFAGPRQPGPEDFTAYSAVLLTAVAVLVTALGVFVAILALAGYTEMKRMAQRVGEESAVKHVKDELDSGSLRTNIETLVMDFLTDRYDDNRLNQMIEARIHQMIPGRRTDNAIDRALDNDDDA
ncbi:hypothetical protein [Brevundimonas sp. A19_0]|uniref:hypothetical protein n=1 Tax=Brevundimonas sp. A19_0 TaxID=2821087 RepID=UPI001ADA93D7|nr:hypothetical protein [Brevundimonas sp. A19_0]MBO9501994.1 hypothetical protein [Brevundimonas sp. A19_0]